MIFNSLTFLVFFAIVLGLHYLPWSWRIRKTNLLVASYIFYAAWNPPFVMLLLLSTVLDWFLAKRIHAAATDGMRKALVWVSVAVNIGLLAYFKYGMFVLENFVNLLGSMGIHYQPAPMDIILPIGISFYTFQTLSYTIDVYRRRLVPGNSFLDYALYVTFFPQLVAGPIVRADEFLPQCATPRKATPPQIGWGLILLVIGLFQKIVLADTLLSPVVEKIYDAHTAMGTLEAWTGTLAFSAQIFFDFSGYSTCAIGIALCLGFSLPDNFRYPYAAIGFSDFWRRWHISLSRWLRDYLYVPLGGDRAGALLTIRNLTITMFLGGLWHGASWTFVAWGLLHGVYLVAERLLRRVTSYVHFDRWKSLEMLLALLTFSAVTVAWAFFRAPDITTALSIVSSMLNYRESSALLGDKTILVAGITLLLFLWHWLLRNSTLAILVSRITWWVLPAPIAMMLVLLLLNPGDNRAFIYFQF
jgi:alginate O-acetyltransferase complex protein AlgI